MEREATKSELFNNPGPGPGPDPIKTSESATLVFILFVPGFWMNYNRKDGEALSQG